MKRNLLIFRIFFLSIILFVTSCVTGDPYIFKYGEFNRASPNFNKTPKDRKNVKICYNNASSDLSFLQAMAGKECGLYGRVAKFDKEDFLHCPISTPSGATFLCVKP